MGGKYSKPSELESVAFPKLVPSLPRIDGKTVAITGCTTGTGNVLARLVLEKGGKVIMLNRPSERATAALEELKVSRSCWITVVPIRVAQATT